ncbi:hypothetical protein D584_23411 [Brucella intermedia M86]|uniref:Uncharacterized protein n=1 Tax=Brucella intermedia M86 TaxID=1234597 RepID=M5JK91_9HYPH|nr:hypothetical protein D584_23411 [Brucella intermedia M86]
MPFDAVGLDSGNCSKLALQQHSNATEDDQVLSFDPHLKAGIGRPQDRAGVLEGKEFVGVGDSDRKAITAAFRAKLFGDASGMCNRDE